uniref:Uncharacterized protein n=1 Tax=Clavulina sp. TaxID=1745192 RepID=A0A890JE75_9AGAM|nr:hypothetical protein [Clavulina sp.]
MRIKDLVNKLGKYTSVVLGSMTVESYFRGRQSDLKDTTIDNLVSLNNDKANIIKEQLETIVTDNVLKTKLETTVENVRRSMDNADSSRTQKESLTNKLQSTNLTDLERNNLESELNSVTNTYNMNKTTADSNVTELINSISDWTKGNNNSNNFINNIGEDLNNLYNKSYYLIDSLSQTQKLYLINIFGSTTILFSLSTLIAVYFGDWIIEYFNLETRFPKVSKYFSIRRKLRTSYFIWNSILIFIVLLGLLIINITAFMDEIS